MEDDEKTFYTVYVSLRFAFAFARESFSLCVCESLFLSLTINFWVQNVTTAAANEVGTIPTQVCTK